MDQFTILLSNNFTYPARRISTPPSSLEYRKRKGSCFIGVILMRMKYGENLLVKYRKYTQLSQQNTQLFYRNPFSYKFFPK